MENVLKLESMFVPKKYNKRNLSADTHLVVVQELHSSSKGVRVCLGE